MFRELTRIKQAASHDDCIRLLEKENSPCPKMKK